MTKKSKKIKPVKKSIKSAAKKTLAKKLKLGKPIGIVTHYYKKIKVAIIKFKKPTKTGTKILVKGATSNFSDTLNSMEYDHKKINSAPKNKSVGVKLSKRAREGDSIFPIN